MAETPERYVDIESPEYHRKVGEVVVGGVLRAFSDPGGVRHQAGSAREAIEEFVGLRAADLKTGGLDGTRRIVLDGLPQVRRSTTRA